MFTFAHLGRHMGMVYENGLLLPIEQNRLLFNSVTIRSYVQAQAIHLPAPEVKIPGNSIGGIIIGGRSK